MTRLTALDGTFLELEDADPSAHMHIGAILVFEPCPDTGGPPALARLRSHLDERLDALPAYRRRLAHPGAGRLRWQEWVDDEEFDIAVHVRSARLRKPGGWEQLLDWAGEYYSVRLERDRPLWEIVLVTGLADGHWALVTKTHHCLVDGVGSVQVVNLLLDNDGLSMPGGSESASGVGGLLGSVISTAVHAATHPLDVARRAVALGDLLLEEEVHAAATTSLNEPIGERRVLRAASVALDEARTVKHALGGTVNDVALAAVTTGLRSLLLGRGEEPPAAGLRAMVPVSLRNGAEPGPGNRVSSLFVELPVDEPNPIVRYQRLRERTSAAKRSAQPLGADSLLRIGALAPPLLHRSVARTMWAKRLFNVTVTNVPAVGATLSAFGAPVKTVWPLVPIAADHSVGIAIVSYGGRLVFGINADADTVPDVDVLTAGIAEGLADLQRLAHAALETLEI